MGYDSGMHRYEITEKGLVAEVREAIALVELEPHINSTGVRLQLEQMLRLDSAPTIEPEAKQLYESLKSLYTVLPSQVNQVGALILLNEAIGPYEQKALKY